MITLRPQPGPQTEFCASPASVVFYGGAAGGGKALSLDTPIATPTGWTTMGELRAGDFVYDLEGKPTRVEVAHPVQLNRPCYRVTFDDGSSIVADAEHLWVTHSAQEARTVLGSTEDLLCAPKGSRFVPRTPWHGPRAVVAVDPVESVPVRCIKVAAASGVFLAGRSMIPTHNTYALLLEALRYIQKKGYSAILFRKNFTQIKNAGGIWDTAVTLYSQIPGAVVRESALTIEWPKFGSKITFSHMQHEQDKFSHQGAQYPFIGWDEVPHFSREQFMYLFSRNRLGLCDPSVIPTIRATCNPEPGWVRDFLAPWVDSKYPHPAKSGETRYFYVKDDRVQWVPPDELILTGDPLKDPKSCAFIRSTIHDNKELLKNDPSYLQQLNSLTAVQRQRLLLGNWDVEEGDKIFDRDWFRPLLPADLPPKFKRLVRYYDLAGTGELEKNGYRACWTAGVLLGLTFDGRIIVLDVRRFRKAPGEVQEAISKIAADDKANFGNVDIRVEQEPGSAGKFVIESYTKSLAGYNFAGDRPTGEKTARWGPFASQARGGNVYYLKAPWNEAFLSEVGEAPFGDFKDQVDAAAGAYSEITLRKPFAFA